MEKIEKNFRNGESVDSILISIKLNLIGIFKGETNGERTSQLLFTPALMGGFLGSDVFRFLSQDLPPEFFTEDVLTKGPYLLLGFVCMTTLVAVAGGLWFARMLRRGAVSFEINTDGSTTNGITTRDAEIKRIAVDELEKGTNADDVADFVRESATKEGVEWILAIIGSFKK